MEIRHFCPACAADSATRDYCDNCGTAMAAKVGGQETLAIPTKPASGTSPAADTRCPVCTALHMPDDLFCEVCGTDFATGEEFPLPPPPGGIAVEQHAPGIQASSEWFAVITADRGFFEGNQAETSENMSFPEGLIPREVPLLGDEVVVGRRDDASGFFPDIDLSAPIRDPAVSRRHAVLRREPDGSWTLTDEDSMNGTWLNGDRTPLQPCAGVTLRDGDRINLGAFSLIVVRRNARAASR